MKAAPESCDDSESSFEDCLAYAAITEGSASAQRDMLLALPTLRTPAVTTFLDDWLEDEERHHALLDGMLARYQQSPPGPAPKRRAARVGALVRPLVGHPVRPWTAVFLSVATVNELTAWAGYSAMCSMVDNQDDRRVLGRIAADELDHARFFAATAQPYLSSRTARVMVRVYFRLLWRPVGYWHTSPGQWRSIARSVFCDERRMRLLRRVDELAERLLGVSDLRSATSFYEQAMSGASGSKRP